jgi:hypothetical protein
MKELLEMTLWLCSWWGQISEVREYSGSGVNEVSRRARRLFPCQDTCYIQPTVILLFKCGSGECPDRFTREKLNPQRIFAR